MDEIDWNMIRHFNEHEKWGNPNEINPILVNTLDNLREEIGHPIIIHAGYENRIGISQHPLGNAVDCHCEGVGLVDFFLYASRYSALKGIGIYPLWDPPGLHLDVRHSYNRATWGCMERKKYIPLNRNFIMNVLFL